MPTAPIVTITFVTATRKAKSACKPVFYGLQFFKRNTIEATEK